MKDGECSALRREGRREFCFNGFPVTAACVGIDGAAAPVCCNETLCGRWYASNGGKPAFSSPTPDKP